MNIQTQVKMHKAQVHSLTWSRTASLTTVVLIGSVALGIWLVSQRIFLSPPFFRYTFYFYEFIGLAPALVTLLICVRYRPTGSRTRLILLALVSGTIFVVYLALINPSLYSNIECDAQSRSGLAVHQECTCQWAGTSDTSQVKCSSDRWLLSPLMRLTEQR
jgi:hypothetical protein